MTPSFLRTGIAAAAAVLCSAAPAFAEPAFDATLSASATSFTWDGNPGNGFNKTELLEYTPCGSPNHDCEDVLVKLENAGQLTAEIKTPSEPDDASDAGNVTDLDLQLYESNAAGEPGKQLVATNSTSAQEKITKKGLLPGFYLVRVDYYRGVQVTYSGRLDLLPAASALPAPVVTPPVVTPAPPAKPAPSKRAKLKKKRAACQKKAKKIKNKSKRKRALKRCSRIR